MAMRRESGDRPAGGPAGRSGSECERRVVLHFQTRTQVGTGCMSKPPVSKRKVNVLNEHYTAAFGYPSLPFTIRGGITLTIGGEGWRPR